MHQLRKYTKKERPCGTLKVAYILHQRVAFRQQNRLFESRYNAQRIMNLISTKKATLLFFHMHTFVSIFAPSTYSSLQPLKNQLMHFLR